MPRALFAALLLGLVAPLVACGDAADLELRVTNAWRTPVVVALHEGTGAEPADLRIVGQQVVAPDSEETFRLPMPAGEWTLSIDGEPVHQVSRGDLALLSIRIAEDRSMTIEAVPAG